MKLACAAIVKSEARHIGEWLAYQFALGFDTVLLLDNLSTDATQAIARKFATNHDLRILDWPLTTADYQIKAYQFAITHLEQKFDWIAFFDTDEFLVLDPGLTLQSALAARTESAAIAIPWAIFGASGHGAIPPGLTIENFVYRAPASFDANKHIKSIIRPARYIAGQTPHSFIMDGPITDLAGRAIAWMRPGVANSVLDFSPGKLHHYFTRSLQHWSEKLARGYHDTTRDPAEFTYYDRNDMFDDSAARLAPAVATILAKLP